MAEVKHPAPERHRVSWLRQLIGLLGAPTIWAIQMNISEMLASYACYPKTQPLSAPLLGWLYPVLMVVGIIAIAAGSFSAYIAWTSWRRARHESHGDGGDTMEIGEGRTRFLALMSAISSGIFIVAILFNTFNLLLVSPCSY